MVAGNGRDQRRQCNMRSVQILQQQSLDLRGTKMNLGHVPMTPDLEAASLQGAAKQMAGLAQVMQGDRHAKQVSLPVTLQEQHMDHAGGIQHVIRRRMRGSVVDYAFPDQHAICGVSMILPLPLLLGPSLQGRGRTGKA